MAGHPNSQDRQVVIGETTLVLRFGVRAMLALKDKWKLDTDEALQKRLTAVQTDDMVDVIWAAALAHQRTMSRDQVLDLVDDAGLEGLAEAAQELLHASAPPDTPREAARK